MDAKTHRSLRELAGLSQLELAGILGVTQGAISAREMGVRPVPRRDALLLRYVAAHGLRLTLEKDEDVVDSIRRLIEERK